MKKFLVENCTPWSPWLVKEIEAEDSAQAAEIVVENSFRRLGRVLPIDVRVQEIGQNCWDVFLVEPQIKCTSKKIGRQLK